MTHGRDAREPSVVFMITSLIVGGAQKQLREVATRLPDRGWDVRGVVTLHSPGGPYGIVEVPGLPHYSLEMRRKAEAPLAVARAVRLLPRLEPDVLVTFLFHASMVGAVAGRIAQVPGVLASVRSERLGGASRDFLFRATAPLRHGELVNSEAVARSLVSRGLVSGRRCRVVPNGIDSPGPDRETRESVRARLGIAPESFVWLAVGSLLPAKDHITLLEAFSLVGTDGPILLIAGEGPLEEDLRLRARSLGLDGRVCFLGLRNDVDDLLLAADGFVSSSAWEGMPNAVMEAMAAGKPVVATEVGGGLELIRDGRSGLLVPAKDPRRLAAGMRQIMDSGPAWRRSLGEAARSAVLRSHGWDRSLGLWDQALRSVLPGEGPPSTPSVAHRSRSQG